MAKSLDDYKCEKRNLENQIYSQRKKNEKISGEIQRLEDAYKKLGKIKRDNAQNADKVRDNVKLKNVANDVAWRGQYKNQFDDVMNDYVKKAGKDFFNSIDEIQDEIGRALDQKRGEYDTGSRVLNGLNRAWNNVAGIIRNWVN